MTAYRTCSGCMSQGKPCATKETMRASIKGLGITSVKWKCADRVSRFKIGDAVWANTYSSYGNREDDGAAMALFPAIVTDVIGSRAIVYINNGVLSECEDYEFEAKGNGFCGIPFGRLQPRNAAPQSICKECRRPESFGHAEGYFCSVGFQSLARALT